MVPRGRLATQTVIASPSLPVILSVAKNLTALRTGSAKQSLVIVLEIAELVPSVSEESRSEFASATPRNR